MADILIKGMELPTDGHCYLGIFSDGEIRKWDNFRREFVDTGATAIELPSHGRLIDADALIKRNRESKEILEDFKGDPTLVNVGYKSVIWEIKDLENAPTVLEASNGSDN